MEAKQNNNRMNFGDTARKTFKLIITINVLTEIKLFLEKFKFMPEKTSVLKIKCILYHNIF